MCCCVVEPDDSRQRLIRRLHYFRQEVRVRGFVFALSEINLNLLVVLERRLDRTLKAFSRTRKASVVDKREVLTEYLHCRLEGFRMTRSLFEHTVARTRQSGCALSAR